jgi:hypothetical protein
MFDIENEYKRAFRFQKRWAKHWTTMSAHRAHSSTQSMRDPAQITYDYIISIDTKGYTFKEKFELLNKFFLIKNEEETKKQTSRNGYYREAVGYNDIALRAIENGESVVVGKL